MVKRIGGARRKSRQKFSKPKSERGRPFITKFMQEFSIGETVSFKAEPSYQKGIYHARFHGKCGKVVDKRGECYIVEFMDKDKSKRLIVHPVHLKRVGK